MRYSLQFFDSDGAVVRTLEWGGDDARRARPVLADVERLEMRHNGRLVVRQQAKLGIDPRVKPKEAS